MSTASSALKQSYVSASSKPQQTVIRLLCVNTDGHLLALQCSDKKSAAGTWRLMSGKVHDGEENHQAVVRECHEETRLRPSRLVHLMTSRFEGKIFVDYISLTSGTLKINDEHSDFRWVKSINDFPQPIDEHVQTLFQDRVASMRIDAFLNKREAQYQHKPKQPK